MIKLWILSSAIVLGIASLAPAAERPNVILMMADDLGWGDPGYQGKSPIRTPHLDQMAAEGLRFERFYAAAPVCSPTRGSCLTGRHPFRYGVFNANVGHLPAEETTLAEVLRDQGYATGHFGKWHLGTLTTTHKDGNRGGAAGAKNYSPPWRNGFDICFSTESKVPTWDPLHVPREFGPGESREFGWAPRTAPGDSHPFGTNYWTEAGEKVEQNLAGDDSRVIIDRVVPFLKTAAEKKQPFLAVIWFHTPHLPVVTGPEFAKQYAKDATLLQRNYHGSVTALDAQVGRLRGELKQLGLAENTLLWFTSDNGPESKTPGRTGGLRERKRSLHEGGVRVPGLLVWPAKITAPRTTTMPCSTSDYFPTVLAALNLTPPARPLDGVNLLPLIDGTLSERPRPIAFESPDQLALIDNRYKLYQRKAPKRKAEEAYELYDLPTDPSESNNLADEKPEIVARMSAALEAWRASCKRSLAGEDYQASPGAR